MPHVEYDGAACELRDGETVLRWPAAASDCRAARPQAGSCGSCMMRAVDAPSRQRGRLSGGRSAC